jgi:hypothetical protein
MWGVRLPDRRRTLPEWTEDIPRARALPPSTPPLSPAGRLLVARRHGDLGPPARLVPGGQELARTIGHRPEWRSRYRPSPVRGRWSDVAGPSPGRSRWGTHSGPGSSEDAERGGRVVRELQEVRGRLRPGDADQLSRARATERDLTAGPGHPGRDLAARLEGHRDQPLDGVSGSHDRPLPSGNPPFHGARLPEFDRKDRGACAGLLPDHGFRWSQWASREHRKEWHHDACGRETGDRDPHLHQRRGSLGGRSAAGSACRRPLLLRCANDGYLLPAVLRGATPAARERPVLLGGRRGRAGRLPPMPAMPPDRAPGLGRPRPGRGPRVPAD